MKKLLIALFVMMMVLSGCSSDKGLEIIPAKDVIERLENDETMVVVIGQSQCSACIAYKPILEELLKNYTVNLAYVELDKDVSEDVVALIETFLLEAEATPTTYFFKDGELVETVVSFVDYRETKKLFESNGALE